MYYRCAFTSSPFCLLNLWQSSFCFDHPKEIILKVTLNDLIILKFNYLCFFFYFCFFSNQPPWSVHSIWLCYWPHFATTFFPSSDPCARFHLVVFLPPRWCLWVLCCFFSFFIWYLIVSNYHISDLNPFFSMLFPMVVQSLQEFFIFYSIKPKALKPQRAHPKFTFHNNNVKHDNNNSKSWQLLNTNHCCKHFTWIKPFDLYSMRWLLLSAILLLTDKENRLYRGCLSNVTQRERQCLN